MYIGREMCRRAATLEPVMVFPDLIYTQILEARHCIGTIEIQSGFDLAVSEQCDWRDHAQWLSEFVIVARSQDNSLMTYLTQMQMRTPTETVLYA